MSWTTIFPVLDEEMLAAYQAGVTEAEQAEFEEWFGLKQRVSPAHAIQAEMAGTPTLPEKHIVSATLFWKHVNAKDPDLPTPTREMLVDARRLGLVKRFAPWDSYNSDLSKQVRYRPMLAGHFGARGGIPVRELIEAFVWHWRRGTLPNTAKIPGLGERPIQFSEWPNYGFDEWFLLAALYPRLVPGGTLTFIPSEARSLLLPIDVEYATWANPQSECVVF